MKLRFASCEIDLESYVFSADGVVAKLEPQVFDLLAHLAKNPERLISREELVETIWDGRIVSESTIDARIAAARRAVGDDGKRQAVIATVPRRGIRLVVPVKLEEANESAPRSTDPPSTGPQLNRPSIAVLPFDNISGDPAQQHYADGLAHDIITALSRFHSFLVIARNSSFAFRGQSIDVREIGEQLGARYILQGSVHKAGDRLRVNAQLIEVATRSHIWADRYDRSIDDIFAIQDEITQTVCNALEVALSIEEQRRARIRPPENMDAWTAYHLGLHEMIEADRQSNRQNTAQRFAQAREHLGTAAELDPYFARPLSLHALVFRREVVQEIRRGEDAREAMEHALQLTDRAIALDPMDGQHHVIRATLLGWRGDWDAALRSIRTGLELNPNSALAWLESGWVKAFGHWPEQAIADLEIVGHLSPLDPLTAMRYPIGGYALLRLGQYDEAAEWASRGTEALPSLIWPPMHLAVINAEAGRHQEAREMAEEGLRRRPGLTLSKLRENMTYLADEPFKKWYLDKLSAAGIPEDGPR